MPTTIRNRKPRLSARRLLTCLALISAAAVIGCSSSAGDAPDGPTPFPVHGKVTYKGKPAAGFAVAFHPVNAWKGVQFAPSATTDANGEFTLRSYEENDGAPTGDYTVTFTWPKQIPGPDPDEGMETVDQLRGRYRDARRSKFTATVAEGENELETFELK